LAKTTCNQIQGYFGYNKSVTHSRTKSGLVNRDGGDGYCMLGWFFSELMTEDSL